MEPRSIEPQDIRPGMRVRAEHHAGAYQVTTDGIVAAIEGGRIRLGRDVDDDSRRFLVASEYDWTLLADAPTPDRPVGSHWRDPETGAEYVVTDRSGGRYQLYRSGDSAADAILDADTYVFDGEKIARLTPIPAFDPAVLWPKIVRDERACRQSDENGNRLFCCRVSGHDGLHAAYTCEPQPVAVWGDPR